MSRTESYDAQLAAIRLAQRAIVDAKSRHEIEQARYGLFSALNQQDYPRARSWIRTLRIATRAVPDWATADVQAALSEIESAIPV